jgi:hypothetical protein
MPHAAQPEQPGRPQQLAPLSHGPSDAAMERRASSAAVQEAAGWHDPREAILARRSAAWSWCCASCGTAWTTSHATAKGTRQPAARQIRRIVMHVTPSASIYCAVS